MPKINLAMTDKQRKDMQELSPSAVIDKAPKYPYGTEITLRDEHANKLELDDMPADTDVTITGKGKITRVEKMDRVEGKPTVTVTIQFTDIEVYPAKPPTEGEMFEGVAGRDYED